MENGQKWKIDQKTQKTAKIKELEDNERTKTELNF